MSDYISRKAALEAFIEWGFSTMPVREVLSSIPAADVAPVVHGAWGEWENGAGHYCTVCGKDTLCDGVEQEVLSNFCPNCGAKMGGGKHERAM